MCIFNSLWQERVRKIKIPSHNTTHKIFFLIQLVVKLDFFNAIQIKIDGCKFQDFDN
jgi:hypothetical protein